MREDEFARFVQLGRDNADAIELVRRHCRHARVEMPAGNSWVGSMYDLPMGRLEVRCQYASAPARRGTGRLSWRSSSTGTTASGARTGRRARRADLNEFRSWTR